ncbi:MAG: alpha/beta hydrolase [Sphingomicrobium sp.]
MGKVMASAGIAAVLVAGMAAAQQRQRLPAECRQQILALCQMGGGMRECVRAALLKLSEPCRKAISDRSAAGQPLLPGMAEMPYGRDPLQRLDLAAPTGNKRPPLVLFIHGGGWSIGDKRHAIGAKASHFLGKGYAFASLNYRLVPQATVEQQAADIAAAIAWLRTNAARSNYDGKQIVLMSHSAGAHLAALVGTDPRYLAAAEVPMGAVKGVVLLDGAGYDVAQQMARPGNLVPGMYEAAFGKEPARQKALSPTMHAAAPNVGNWLILPIEGRADSGAQSRALAAALASAGASARVVPVPGESHGSLNKGLGGQGDFATGEVDRFLAGLR